MTTDPAVQPSLHQDALVHPTTTPNNPNFSSGPCAKRPGWTLAALSDAVLGRSHRAKPGKAKLKQVIDLSHKLLCPTVTVSVSSRPLTPVQLNWHSGPCSAPAALTWLPGKASAPPG